MKYSIQKKKFRAWNIAGRCAVVGPEPDDGLGTGDDHTMLDQCDSQGKTTDTASACPFAAGAFATAQPALSLRPAIRLALPNAKAAWIERGASSEGAPLLTLWHLGHEIVFDDPRQFAFAHGLVGRTDFTAGEAMAWAGLDWNETAGLLDDLLESGVLTRDLATPVAEKHDHRPMPDPLPLAPMTAPRAWTDSASLMAELTGTALDPYWLETVVPVFRVAHCFLDADGRQVGEANAFPPAVRLAVSTDWRGCPYPGNRYQAEKPINFTALKAMRVHWRQILALVARMREAYLARCPDARPDADGRWTVGHVERMTCGVLALPSLMLLRAEGRVANGDLHPALSGMFRVTDGVRLVMHQMLFLPVYETMRSPDDRVDAATILAYADRNFAFHSDHAVCAGPRFMVEDLLGVMLDGRAPKGGMDDTLEPELEAAAAMADEALNYAFLGLEAFGTVFSLWPAMTRTYARLHALLAEAESDDPQVAAIAKRFAGHFDALSARSYLADEAWRQHREAVYDDMVARCHQGRTGMVAARTLSQDLAPPAANSPPIAGARRRPVALPAHAVAAVFGTGNGLLAERFAAEIEAFLALGQRVVACATRVQAETAQLLGRAAPAQRLTLAHLNLHNVLMGEDIRSLPFLPNEIADLFGVSIHVDDEKIEFQERVNVVPSLHSLGAKPFGSRKPAQA
jgi:hypothetical protein